MHELFTNTVGFRVACLLAIGVLIGGIPSCQKRLPPKQRVDQKSSQAIGKADVSMAGKKILLVQSYHAEYPWVAAITEGVQQELKDSGVDLKVFYMDTKRRTDEAWKVKAGTLADQMVQTYHPDLIITADDNAQQYFARKYVNQKIPIVFCGVNSDPAKYGFPASNITGIIERPNLLGTLKFLNRIHPVQRVAILSSDDPTSVGALHFMRQMYTGDFQVVRFHLVSDFDEWKRLVKELNTSVDALGIYMYHTLKQKGQTESLDPKEVMQWTRENVTIPTFGFFEFGIQNGLLAGVVESGHEYGQLAGKQALEILKGVSPAKIPMIKATVGTQMLNRITAEKLGIPLSEHITQGVVLFPSNE